MRVTTASLLIATLVAGCAAPQPYVIRNKLDHAAMAPYLQEGKAKITGQAFLKTRGGDVKYGAGNRVEIYPAVAYIEEYNSISPYQINNVSGRDPDWYKYVKSTTTDGSGNFEFVGIPEGVYYVETLVTWEVPSRYGMSTQGGVIKKKIKVPREGTLKIILTE